MSYANSIIVSPWGEVTGRLDESAGILYQELDLALVDRIREQLPIMQNQRTDLYEVQWKQK